MNEKSKGRAVPPKQSPALAQMGQMASTQRLAAQMAQMAGTVESAQRFADQAAGVTGAESAQRFANQAVGMTGAVESARRMMGQMTGVPDMRRMMGQMTGVPDMRRVMAAVAKMTGVADTQRLAAQVAGTTESVKHAQWLAAQMIGVADTQWLAAQVAATGNLASAQRLAAQAAKMAAPLMVDLTWIKKMTAFPMGDLTQAVNVLPSTVQNRDATALFRPLLESTEFRPFGGAAVALAGWAEDRLSGTQAASPERFSEIAGALADVELDEEGERRLERLAEDESALRSVAEYWGLDRLALTRRETIAAVSILAGFTSFLILFVGMVAAPALTLIFTGSIGGGVATLKTVHGLMIKFSPEAQAQLDAMGPTDAEPGSELDIPFRDPGPED